MTPKNIDLEQRSDITRQEVRELLQELNQKIDYIIEILREEGLRYPHHQTFLDGSQKQTKEK